MRDLGVMIVDDSAAMRRALASVIAEAPGLRVAGQAANGRQALEMLDAADPDLVTLDVEMPELDGLATLRELRRRRPRLPVIMLSTLTRRSALTTIEALSLGAGDYLAKPEGSGNPRQNVELLRRELLPRVRALAHRAEPATQAVPPPPSVSAVCRSACPALPARQAAAAPPALPRRRLAGPAELLVIGVSTGGPNALARLLPQLPAALPVPVLIVQHMPPVFTRMLAERLDQISPLAVREAVAGVAPEAGEVWLARGDWHLEVAREAGRLCLREHQGPPVNSCRPAVDPLFRSAARATEGALVALVLTGMGRDGCEGAREIRAAGGLVLAQDEESSVVWGMPGAVAQTGLADAVLPLDELAPLATRLLRPARLPEREAMACR
jgi:two-component system chemotaxis response regulator CheB